MTVFYATHDADGDRIAENANILKFATLAEAKTWLAAPYDAIDWNLDTMKIGAGSFSDCWIKSQSAPKVGDHWIAPFSRAQLSVRRPGQHPGGKVFWTEPRPKVLVVLTIAEA